MSALLTSSRLSCARQCQRKHRYKYGLGYRPTGDVHALRFGTLVHAGLEAWWKASGDARLDAALAAVQVESDVWDRIRAEEVLRGYHYRWESEPYETIAVEQQFEAPLINPETGRPSQTWRLGGKVDAIVRDLRDGRVLVLEHKTSSADITPGSEYWRRLRIDGQVSIYYEGARALGHNVEGCLYDVLAKPGLQPKAVPLLDEEGRKVVLDADGERVLTAKGEPRQTGDTAKGYVLQTREETPEEYQVRVREHIAADPIGYYQRGEVPRLDGEVGEALHDVWQLGRQIREAELAERFPRNPDACTAWGRTCEFFDVCTGAGSLEDPVHFTRSTDVHPELAQEASTA